VPTTAPSPVVQLAARYDEFRARNPKAYLRDAAAALDVSEAELLVATKGDAATPLDLSDLPVLLADIAAWGDLRTMSRNDDAVIEQDGRYDGLRFFERGMGQTVGSIDLRIFGWRWVHAWAVEDVSPNGTRRSVQFFDTHGTSIHKVFAPSAEPFEALRARWGRPASEPTLPAVTPATTATDRPDADVDAAELHRRWDAMQDTHEFHGLLRELRVGRLQAMRLAGPDRAMPVAPDALAAALKGAADAGEKLMIFVGNTGVVQIFIGTIRKVVPTPGWLNILDPGFNLHVRDGSIAHAFVVTKPTVDGPVRSLECYDARGELVVQLFGKRLEGESTPAGWGAVLDAVVAEHAQ
jgi:putative hemin transport protein